MNKVYAGLGLLTSVLSMVRLAKEGFDFGSFTPPLERALEYYERFTGFLFGWAEPYINDALGPLLDWTDWDSHLYPHWKHVVILMWLYTASDALSNWNFGAIIDGTKWRPRRPLAVSTAVFGGAVALIAGVAAGMVELHNVNSSLVMATVVISSFVLYEFGFNALATTFLRDKSDSWWFAFRSHLRPAIQLAVAGGIILLLCTQAARTPLVQALPSPGLALLAACVVILALYRVGVGSFWAFRHRGLAERWSEVFVLSISGPFGLRILKAFGGAVLFILAGAGLQF